MKSYQQFCSVAHALDLVGDRWVLLIVRELLAFGPSRYSDLKRALPGVASNLLAERLKTMEADGLIEQFDAPAPIGTRLYRLTDRGRELEDVVRALSKWGLETMVSGPANGEAIQPQWIALLGGLTLTSPRAVSIGIDGEGEQVSLDLDANGFRVRRGLSADAEVTLAGTAHLIGGVLAGLITVAAARRQGLKVTGRAELITDLVGASL